MKRPRVVAIDGAAGVGKSTLARALAARLGLPYINTGLMYRALAAESIRRGIAMDDVPSLIASFRDLRFSLRAGSPPELEVEGYAEADLVTPEVEGSVSVIARHPAIREQMRARQRMLGELGGAVMEGRDIGSVVFPDATVKLFLTATSPTRASRRALERGQDEGGAAATAAALQERDARDARTTPFEPSPGAVVLDTGGLDVAATLERALAVISVAAPELVGER